jgi:hypothetical protein
VAFLTLDALRTTYLNIELGLASDADLSFGSDATRNFYLQNAIRKLWPVCGRLTSESVTTVANQSTYTLSTIEDIERIEVLDPSSALRVQGTVRSWQIVREETADPPTLRLLIPTMAAGLTLRVMGYIPYTVPASSPPSGSGSVDFPARMAHVVVTGARAEAYRAKLNQFANFAAFANENRQNVLQPAEILELLRETTREFERLKVDHRRDFAAPKRARTQTS